MVFNSAFYDPTEEILGKNGQASISISNKQIKTNQQQTYKPKEIYKYAKSTTNQKWKIRIINKPHSRQTK